MGIEISDRGWFIYITGLFDIFGHTQLYLEVTPDWLYTLESLTLGGTPGTIMNQMSGGPCCKASALSIVLWPIQSATCYSTLCTGMMSLLDPLPWQREGLPDLTRFLGIFLQPKATSKQHLSLPGQQGIPGLILHPIILAAFVTISGLQRCVVPV